MKYLKEFIVELYAIYTRNHLGYKRKTILLFSWIKIRSIRFTLGKLRKKSKGCISACGFKVKFKNFEDFYWTFKEVFIDEDYYFSSKKDTPFVIDCGGNIGLATLYFKFLYPQARVLIFEPMPENITYLKKNIKQLKDVRLVEKAVGRSRGEARMFGDRRAATLSENLIQEQNKVSDEYKGKELVVCVDTLSDYIDTDVDFLKLDIEGAEGDVLEELVSSQKIESVRQIAMEYHRVSFTENTLSRILAILEEYRFDTVFSGDFIGLRKMPKRDYYNFMLYAQKQHSI